MFKMGKKSNSSIKMFSLEIFWKLAEGTAKDQVITLEKSEIRNGDEYSKGNTIFCFKLYVIEFQVLLWKSMNEECWEMSLDWENRMNRKVKKETTNYDQESRNSKPFL